MKNQTNIDYQKIEKICRNNSVICKDFVDGFLKYFIAEQEGLDKIIIRDFNKYENVLGEIPKKMFGLIFSQLIMHRIFKKKRTC
jgi:hypothetical protein